MDQNQKNKKQEEKKKLEERIQDLDNKYKRALADYQNLEKRTLEEKKSWAKFASKDLILKLLPVLDTLMLASKNINDKGLDIAIAQFLDVLKQEGVYKIETTGKMFDPKVMEAVDTEEGKEGLVLQEIRSGYMIGDTVLRAAMVKVGKEKSKEEKQAEEEAKKELYKGDYM